MQSAFIHTIKNTFGADGESWLSALPDLIAEASRRWGLTGYSACSQSFLQFCAFARRDEVPFDCVVGKLRADGRSSSQTRRSQRDELTSEIAALQLYNGRGAVRLLDADRDKGMLLLERLQPGGMLSELEDDERATHIAADVMSQLWRPVPENTENFIQLKDWFDGFKRLRRRFDGKTGPLPEKLVEMAESLSRGIVVRKQR